VLTIQVRAKNETDLADAPFTVTGAYLDGISQEIADNLLDQDLSAARIPVRLLYEAGNNTAAITRDESGRVRTTVNLSVRDAGELTFTEHDEAQRIRGAAALVERVLSKSLAASGVREIKTDDKTGRRSK
jgi:hypothetical protein